MPCWQYAQLTITVDGRGFREDARSVVCPAQDVGENCSDSGQTVLELLKRFGADGWELAGPQEYRDGGDGTSHWEAARLLTLYTFNRPVPARIAAPSVRIFMRWFACSLLTPGSGRRSYRLAARHPHSWAGQA